MKNSDEKILSPIERAIWTALIAGIYIAIYFIPESILRTNLCLFKMLTGIDCPLCGMTESMHLASRGEIFASLSRHPLGVALVASIFVFTPFIVAGKIPEVLARYALIFLISGFAAWWILKTFIIL